MTFLNPMNEIQNISVYLSTDGIITEEESYHEPIKPTLTQLVNFLVDLRTQTRKNKTQ